MSRRRLDLGLWALSVIAGAGLVLAPSAAAAPASQSPTEWLDRFLALLTNPNVAYMLLVLGLLGIVGELVTTGVVFPGVAGVICLFLSLYGLLRLPTNWIGLALIAAGVVMFLLDIKVAGWALSVGGAVAFGLGSLLIFTPFWVAVPASAGPVVRLNPWLILATTGGVAAFFMLGLSAAVAAQFRPVAVGKETLIGKTGVVRRDLSPEGIVHVAGEEWSAASADGSQIPAGTAIRVLQTDGIRLQVEVAARPPEEPQG